MAYPTNKHYACAAGQSIWAGRHNPATPHVASGSLHGAGGVVASSVVRSHAALLHATTGTLHGVGAAFVGASVRSAAPGAGVSSLSVLSSVGGSSVPFAAGFAFKQGDVPSSSYITTSSAGVVGLQVTPKNSWRDGSLKFALVSGRINLSAGVEAQINLATTSTAPTGTALTTANLKATSAVATIGYGAYGSVTWSGTDWDSPFQTVASGPQMSSWVYRKSIGSDAHLVGWCEVRLFAGGAVEVLPWIENGYLMVAAPGERSDTATFTLGGTQRFSQSLDLLNHTRAVLASGTTLSHWLGTDPGVSIRHNTTYLMGTKLTPNYWATVGSTDAIWSRLVTSYTPLARSNFQVGMGDTGYDLAIGPLPEWDVAYLCSGGDSRAWQSIQVNGYASGRYGIHFRDETTNRAPRLSDHPNLVYDCNSAGIAFGGTSTTSSYTPAATGTVPPDFDTPHMPAIGYLAYIVTGRWYFIDELQSVAALLVFKQYNDKRNYAQGVIQSSSGCNTIRGAAWALRSLGHAAAMTPDADTQQKSELVGYVQYNIDWNYGHYVTMSNNTLGLADGYYLGYQDKAGIYTSASWMDDFYTFAVSFIKDMQPHTSTYDAKLDAVLAYKYKAVVGRLGPDVPGSYSYRRAAQYTMPWAPEVNPDFAGGTGPWYADWGAAYVDQGFSTNGSGTNLLDGYVDQSAVATSYWANFLPAVAYAVDNRATGALDAYNRLTGASNWATNAAYFNATPVWSIAPRNPTSGTAHATTGTLHGGGATTAGASNRTSGAYPAWRQAMTARTWVLVGNTPDAVNPEKSATYNQNYPSTTSPWHGTSGFMSMINAWAGGYYDPAIDRLYLIGGGHTDYAGNEVLSIDMNMASPVWSMRRPPTGSIGNAGTLDDGLESTDKYFDGRPRSMHTWNQVGITPDGNVWVLPGTSMYKNGGASMHACRYNPSIDDWDRFLLLTTNLYYDTPFQGGGCDYDPTRNVFWTAGYSNFDKFDIGASTWTRWGTPSGWSTGYFNVKYYAAADLVVMFRGMGATPSPDIALWDPITSAWTIPTTTGTAPTENLGQMGIQWIPSLGAYLLWGSGPNFYTFTPPGSSPKTNTWTWGTLSADVSNTISPTPDAQGTYGRFFYSPTLHVVGVINSTTQQMNVFALD